MTDRAAAAVPFAAAAKLVGELAGITLTGKRARRRAEADGQAAAAVIEAEAAAITARQLAPMPPGRAAARHAVHLRSTAPACRWSPPRPRAGTARPRTARPAPARSSWPACSPRHASMRTAGRSATRARRHT